jgi:hypothetical protein
LSNPPLQRPKPRKSSQNLEAQQGSGRRCIIDQQFTASPLNGKPLDNRAATWAKEFWRRRPSTLGCNCVLARRRSLRFVAAAVLLLHRGRQASIAGIAEKEQRLRCIDFGGAGRALAASGAGLHPGSTLGRPISRSRFRGSALAGATKPDLGNHRWSSTNWPSSSTVMRLWRGCNLAPAAGEA